MPKIASAEMAKPQYMGCTVRVAIDMAKTALTVVFTTPKAVQPAPTTIVAETKGIEPTQFVDLTAFILSCSTGRPGGSGPRTARAEALC